MTAKEKQPLSDEEIRARVREGYGRVAAERGSCCAPTCCGPSPSDDPAERARQTARDIGYDEADVHGAAAEGNLGLGCGNPTALAALRPGEVVIDLGAGAGFDALIAGPEVAPDGRVIGVDMTPEMLKRARENAVRAGLADVVEFREGVIEDLPVVSESADVVISNCVVNLSPDKPRAFREAFRVLKPGGRLAVSDILLTEPLPEPIRKSAEAFIACVGGAALEQDYLGAIHDAGFVNVRWTRKSAAPLLEGAMADPMVKAAVRAVGEELVHRAAATVFSYSIEADKP